MTLGTGKTAPPQIVKLAPPEPVLGTAVSSAERKDDVKLSSALAKALEEDPSLRVAHVQDTGETVMEGQGEMHLRVALERLTGKYGIAVKTHEPTIPYKETIRGRDQRPRPPQEAVRRPRPVRRRRAGDQAAAARLRLRVRRRRSPAAPCRGTTSPRSRRGCAEYLAQGPARLPGGRRRA